ncbi:hypothetical protein MTX26_15615 [Bradyrhizobium sp. ISRA443]|uniref:hypothetical protein n=1 Tax=unclassified Bradyrhizobium TaxID=2631580 RepID=UPI00247947C8|nr:MULTISPECIES: hypothetical protein [unclassified Bradyrhizobium]WGR91795.1 hypothetical protein MTX20_26170 [Bradyrhizobium sp. ISRA435]WGS02157.1 hypothetical protein MTX23_15625 [Bradyrhizobium sp. ISRA436]WGS09042.1 hypothetical protein MTX18_15615 [Bradyrhizobium sp. ISRA437]WGS15931.1 hypothetical protein MTX26_15615 [Bradyrhizobium sp. ISRA443]
MPKTARISTSVTAPVSSISEDEEPDSSQLVTVALFSGIGLLISLVAVITGIQGVWL